MASRKCAYLTMRDSGDFLTDYHLGFDAMEAQGWAIETVDWHDPANDWEAFDAVYLCTAWDYPDHLAEFMDVLQNIEQSSARVVNPLSLVQWTLQKTYLRDLEQRGADIVPSIWGSDIGRERVEDWFTAHDSDRLVVKPAVGTNARDIVILEKPLTGAQHARLLEAYAGRAYIVQPFVTAVVSEGEYSLLYFGGEYSHAILKSPTDGDFRSQEEHGAEIKTVAPGKKLLQAGEKVLSLLDTQPVYVRAEFVRAADDRFLLMELELIEPSLYLRMDDAAAGRFAAAFDKHMNGQAT